MGARKRWAYHSSFHLRKLGSPRAARFRAIDRPWNVNNLVLYPDFGLCFNRVKKSGNSSTLFHLAEQLYGARFSNPDGEFSTYLSEKERALSYGRKLSIYDLVRSVKLFQESFFFTVVRNPFTRILSGYLQGRDRWDKGETKYRTFPCFGNPDAKRGFDQFVSSLADSRGFANSHWKPQSSLLIFPVEYFDFVIHLEDFNHQFRKVLERILVRGAVGREREREREAQDSFC